MPKKKCELGTACPYQNEQQHIWEFTHGEPAAKSSTSGGKRGGKVLGGGGSAAGRGGTGQTLGGSPGRRRLPGLFAGAGQSVGVAGGGSVAVGEKHVKRLTQKRRGEDQERAVAAALERFGNGGASVAGGVRPLPQGKDGGGTNAKGRGIPDGSAPKRARSSSSPGKQAAPKPKSSKRKSSEGGSANAKSQKSFEDWIEESGCSSDEEADGQGETGVGARTGGPAAAKMREGTRDDVILIDD